MIINPLPYQEQIIAFRQELHRFPEISGKEHTTAKRVADFLTQFKPDQILTGVGGTGVVAAFNGTVTSVGPTVLFRAELDALPIEDEIDTDYRSEYAGKGHKCGHDGHMAILGGLASLLHSEKPEHGRVLLLFQPAEETGAGAWDMLQDPVFQELTPDYVFALHNLPGVAHHEVVIRQDVFAAASSGMIIELTGKPSHAAEPENGLNPGLAVAEIIQEFNQLILHKEKFQDLTLLTIIHARLGEVAFGTNPGFATVMATLRAFQPADFEKLKELTSDIASNIATRHKLQLNIEFTETFPATVNHAAAVDIVKKAAIDLHLPVSVAAQPFKWSEDFGYFTKEFKGALFGLGAGKQQPQLHHIDYDFPDDLIPTGARLFHQIAKQILTS